MSDVTKTGDSFYTNEMVDNVLVSRDGFCDAATVVYANGHDLKDPLLSPVYGDMHGFPPAILTTGTRDLLLSNTVRVAPRAARGRRGGAAGGVRRPVARAIPVRRSPARDCGRVRRDRRLLRQASRKVAVWRAARQGRRHLAESVTVGERGTRKDWEKYSNLETEGPVPSPTELKAPTTKYLPSRSWDWMVRGTPS